MTKLWVSCTWATAQVNVDGDLIVFTPPIWQRFRGQRLGNLLRWLRSRGPVAVVEMES